MLESITLAPSIPRTSTAPTVHPGETVRIRNLSRIFSDGSGLQPTNLDIAAGEFVSVLGPSGCGKSTLLRCVAGLERPDTGEIHFGGTVVYDAATSRLVPTRERGLGMVFQDLALWPHLNAHENVAFPLRVARTAKEEVTERVREALHLVGLAEFMEKMPHQLSGGQQQRVAIARAIVARPRVLLMDEPFSALDAALRLQLRDELRELTTSLGLTTLYVTHDQAEAMAMSDRIAVLSRGVLRQVSSPEVLYEAPETRFVAEFIGHCNWLPEQAGVTGVRPEHIGCEPTSVAPTHAPTDEISFTGMITSCTYTGGYFTLTCAVDDALEPWILQHHTRLAPGTPVHLSVHARHLMHIPQS